MKEENAEIFCGILLVSEFIHECFVFYTNSSYTLISNFSGVDNNTAIWNLWLINFSMCPVYNLLGLWKLCKYRFLQSEEGFQLAS